MTASSNPLAKFFDVLLKGQTYLNALYLLLAFPLGLVYFIFLIVGLSLGVALLIVWVGILILLVVLAGWWGFAAFERQMAIWLLREDIPPMQPPEEHTQGIWAKFVAYLVNPVTWKSLVYLLVKFPLGILSFVVVVTLGGLSSALLTAPLTFSIFPMQVELFTNQVYSLDTPLEAALAFLVGVFLVFISMHIMNGLAWISGRFAYIMLGNFPAARRSSAGEILASSAPVMAAHPIQPVAPLTEVPAVPELPAAPETLVASEPPAEVDLTLPIEEPAQHAEPAQPTAPAQPAAPTPFEDKPLESSEI